MVGTTTCTKPNGIILHKGSMRANRPDDTVIQIFLTEEECNQLAKTIQEARRKFWKKVTAEVKHG